MHKTSKPVKNQRVADTSRFDMRVGSVIYQVSVNFIPDAKETLNTKIIRLIKNDMETLS